MSSERADSANAILLAGDEILSQAEELLALIDDEAYRCKVEAAFGATLGGHMRHCIDHFISFLAGVAETWINYDHRERDSVLETDRSAALLRVREIRESLSRLNAKTLARPSSVTCKVRYEGEFAQSAETTFARELMYVVSHAMHHLALMRIMANLLKIELPEQFGVAPSTLAHLQLQKSNPALAAAQA
tara:strand:+ start:2427 stop:2993 length:567 start_codon:yes stop_codon:yes gene_type:complete